MRKSTRLAGIMLVLAALLVALIWYAALASDRRGVLTVSFLNIGQGDSIFIDTPSGRQVLIDGGPHSSVLRQLAQVMPWYDRSIDFMIATHPDADHTTGLIDVLAHYVVGNVMQSSVQGNTGTWRTLQKDIAGERAETLIAERGQIIQLGDGVYIEVLFPDRTVPNVETNVGCVVTRLVYGKTAFMFPCDTTMAIENYLVQLGTTTLKSDVLKAGHHGSKTSSSALFLGYVNPEYGVFSRGCDNAYGHPAPETVAVFARFGIPTFDTCTDGTVTFVSDGQTVVRK